MSNQGFSFSIRIIADSPEEESRVAALIALAFVEEAKIPTVTVVAYDHHINYVNGVEHDVTNTMQGLFRNNPHDPIDSYIKVE